MSENQLPVITAQCVVANDLKFKASLGIGEQAYTSLRLVNRAREFWDVLGAAGTGAAVAKSSLVASTFFAPSGLLGAVGLGTAVTPIGWVALAAVASGGACYGLYQMLGKGRASRVIEIPKYLNTPLDQLGLAVFDLIAPLALRLAAVDGQVESAEVQYLRDYLCEEWGLDEVFVDQALASVAPAAVGGSLEEMARQRAELLHANPDCHHETMARDLSRHLQAMLEAAGPLTESETAALAQVAEALRHTPPSALGKAWAAARVRAAEAGDVVAEGASSLAAQAKATVQRIAPDAGQVRQAAAQASALTRNAATTVADGALRAGERAKAGASELAQQMPELTASAKAAGARALTAVKSIRDRVRK